MDHTSLSLGVLIGLPVAGLFILLSLGAIALGVFGIQRGEPDRLPLIAGGVGALLVTLAVTAFTMYPFSAEYHQWRQHTGTVSVISSRLLSAGDGKSTEQKFVVRFAGSAQEYGVNDTRAAAVKVGDQLTITCKRAWQFSGTDGYDCNYVSAIPAQ